MSNSINFLRNYRKHRTLKRVLGIIVGIPLVFSLTLYSAGVAIIPAPTLALDTPLETPLVNPQLAQSCGLDIGLVVDVSGSTDVSEMTEQKTALSNFAKAFVGTPTVFSLTSFSNDSILKKPFSLSPAEASAAIATDIQNNTDGNTNWDSGLARSFTSFDPRPTKSNLIVIATDGSPNRRGYPTTVDESLDWDNGIAAAIARANLIKAAGTRIVVVGIGEDTLDPATPAEKLQKMINISGPSVATSPGSITALTDVIKVSDFNGIGDALAAFAKQLCGGKVLVQKQFDTDGDGIADIVGSSPNSLLGGFEFYLNSPLSSPVPQTTTDTGSLIFTALNGVYSIVESNVTMNTRLVSAECHKGADPIGTVDLNTRTVSGFTLSTDDTLSCTFVNAPANGTLHLIKHVVGGNQPASAWLMKVVQNNVEVTSSPQPGNEAGVDFALAAGSYTISETGPTGYQATFSEGCQNGNVIVVAGQSTTCTLTNTFTQTTFISLDKSGPATVIPGSNLTYTLGWNVTGNTAATNGVITDTLPANTSFVSADNGGTLNAGVVSWNIGTKEPGASGVVTLVVKSNSPLANDSAITNIANFDTDQTTPESDTVVTTVTSATALSITKSFKNPPFVNPGGIVTYTVVVTNAATATNRVNDAVMTDTLPNGFTFVDGGESTKTFALGHLMPGISATREYEVKVSATQPAGLYTNTAKAKGSNAPEVTATAKVEVRLAAVLGATLDPDLTITKSISQPSALRGETVTYTLTITNTGDANATNVVILDTLPAGLSYVHSAGRTYTWNVGTLNAETQLSFSYDVSVDPTTKAGIYENIAVMVADDEVKREAKAQLTVRVPQVLGLAVTGSGLTDFMIFFLGNGFLALGVIGLTRRHPRPLKLRTVAV